MDQIIFILHALKHKSFLLTKLTNCTQIPHKTKIKNKNYFTWIIFFPVNMASKKWLNPTLFVGIISVQLHHYRVCDAETKNTKLRETKGSSIGGAEENGTNSERSEGSEGEREREMMIMILDTPNMNPQYLTLLYIAQDWDSAKDNNTNKHFINFLCSSASFPMAIWSSNFFILDNWYLFFIIYLCCTYCLAFKFS